MKNKRIVISRKDAEKLAPDYVKFVDGNYSKKILTAILSAFNKLRRNQNVITGVLTVIHTLFRYKNFLTLPA